LEEEGFLLGWDSSLYWLEGIDAHVLGEDEIVDELIRYRDTLRNVARAHLEWAVPCITVDEYLHRTYANIVILRASQPGFVCYHFQQARRLCQIEKGAFLLLNCLNSCCSF
jgi:hypothetical protein